MLNCQKLIRLVIFLSILLLSHFGLSQVLIERIIVKLKKNIESEYSEKNELYLNELIKEKFNTSVKSRQTEEHWITRRVFPYAGKFENRHKEFGLHLWYYLEEKALLSTDEIGNTKLVLERSNKFEIVEIESMTKGESTLVRDTLFNKQWYFENQSSRDGIQADIDLVNALKLEKGKKEIIISIHDSGIDYMHQDVIDNLWINKGEIADNGIDDDNNGYIDDIHGFNFVLHNNDLVDRNGHGTGIASLIGAKSNKSTGLIGIAGGDTPENGVKLMICRLDQDRNDLDIINPQESLVYAADNGSIISSNSWNSFGRNSAVLSAMEYYVSVTANEYLTSGFIVFAAGNNGNTLERYEKENPNVIIV
jgi:hypothetical protein